MLADRFEVFDGVAELLRQVTVDGPALIVLDDMHWADAGSVRLLRFLAPDLPRCRLLVVAAYRDDEVAAAGHPLHEMLAALSPWAQALPLTGLSEADVGQLLARAGRRPAAGGFVRSVCRRTAGNPFLVKQIAQLAAAPPAWAGRATLATAFRGRSDRKIYGLDHHAPCRRTSRLVGRHGHRYRRAPRHVPHPRPQQADHNRNGSLPPET